jgi:dTDP-glucose pyrophosphorylase
MNIVIPAAGKGTRFLNSKYNLPKPCILIDDVPMVVKAIQSLGIKANVIVLIKNNELATELANEIKKYIPQVTIGIVFDDNKGSAETALLAKDLIYNDEELIIANCDQIMNWDHEKVLKQFRKFDGCVCTIKSTDAKHSYADVDSAGIVTHIVEKQVISNVALTGIHYWKKGKDFVSSAQMMIDSNIQSINGEFYIGPTYNMLIKQGKKIGICMIDESEISFVGTPEDLEKYESRKA